MQTISEAVDCGAVDVPLNVDHIVPRSRCGSNRVSDLVAARIPCNSEKEARSIKQFVVIKAQAKAPLKDAVNATR
jgi:5-methylcytosine-specific restriction endonuclease McrA